MNITDISLTSPLVRLTLLFNIDISNEKAEISFYFCNRVARVYYCDAIMLIPTANNRSREALASLGTYLLWYATLATDRTTANELVLC